MSMPTNPASEDAADAPSALSKIAAAAGVMLLTAVLAFGVVSLLGLPSAGTAGLIGFVLGIVAVSAPTTLALSLVVINGLLLTVSVLLAHVLRTDAVAAGVVMVVLALVSALWLSVPVVGSFVSTLPTLFYLLFLAKSVELAGGSQFWQLAVAGLVAVLVAVLVVLLLSKGKPRELDRKLVIKAWLTPTLMSKRGDISRVLWLDRAPRTLQALAAQATLTSLCRQWLVVEEQPDAQSPQTEEQQRALEAAKSNDAVIRAALQKPAGWRNQQLQLQVQPFHKAAAQAKGEGDTRDSLVWQLWGATYEQAQHTFTHDLGRTRSRMPLAELSMSMVRTLLSPDSALFRFGIQRALALGVAIFMMVRSGGSEQWFWITLTLASVLHPNAVATKTRMVQRAVGTAVGVLVAVGIAMVVPASVLMPGLMSVVLLVGIVMALVDYRISSALMAAAVVWMMGVPGDRVAEFAAMRLIDVVIGGVIALLVSWLVLPVRPQPRQRREQVELTLTKFADQIGACAAATPGGTRVDDVSLKALVAAQSQVRVALQNYQADIKLLDEKRATTEQPYFDKLVNISQIGYALAAVAIGIAAVPLSTEQPILQAVEQLQAQLAPAPTS